MYADQTPSSGSMDDGDPTSTNLYLGNLAPLVTEEALQVGWSLTCAVCDRKSTLRPFFFFLIDEPPRV